MKKILAVVVFAFAAVAAEAQVATTLPTVVQPTVRGANQEAFFGYTVGYGPVALQEVPLPTTDGPREFTHGVTLGYTVYFQRSKDIKSSKLGFTIDGNLQFHDSRFAVGTWTSGLMYKANADGKTQPFLRVMGGVAKRRPNSFVINGVIFKADEWSPAVVGGIGLDFAKDPLTSRLKWRVGVDYVWTRFGDRTQNVWRGTTGLVF